MLVSIRLVSQLSEFAFFGASASVGALFVLCFLRELQNLLQKQMNCGIINMLHKFNIMRNGIFLFIGITVPFFPYLHSEFDKNANSLLCRYVGI